MKKITPYRPKNKKKQAQGSTNNNPPPPPPRSPSPPRLATEEETTDALITKVERFLAKSRKIASFEFLKNYNFWTSLKTAANKAFLANFSADELFEEFFTEHSKELDDATKSLMKGGCELEATPYLETFLAYLAKKKKLDITIFYFKSTKKISTRCSFGHAERPTMQFVCIQDHYFLPIRDKDSILPSLRHSYGYPDIDLASVAEKLLKSQIEDFALNIGWDYSEAAELFKCLPGQKMEKVWPLWDEIPFKMPLQAAEFLGLDDKQKAVWVGECTPLQSHYWKEAALTFEKMHKYTEFQLNEASVREFVWGPFFSTLCLLFPEGFLYNAEFEESIPEFTHHTLWQKVLLALRGKKTPKKYAAIKRDIAFTLKDKPYICPMLVEFKKTSKEEHSSLLQGADYQSKFYAARHLVEMDYEFLQPLVPFLNTRIVGYSLEADFLVKFPEKDPCFIVESKTFDAEHITCFRDFVLLMAKVPVFVQHFYDTYCRY